MVAAAAIGSGFLLVLETFAHCLESGDLVVSVPLLAKPCDPQIEVFAQPL
jgi:hypothetical protein